MGEANKSARNKVIGGINWWDYLNSIRPKGHRNTPQYLDYDAILNRSEEIKNINKEIKNRKKQEKKLINIARFKERDNKMTMHKLHKLIVKPTKKAKKDMIKYGLDLGKWWNEQHEI